jgi:ABC-type lipoprotein export system ATPase subunit
LVTHDRDIALQADRIITFGDGRIMRDEAARA